MYCVKTMQSFEESIKKSRFIGVIAPCNSEQEALKILQQIHQQHLNANHIAFAYRLNTPKGLVCRFNDAGEPTGTAGKPIFQHLEGKELINVVLAVIRYFGGVKLGAGGLTRAYGNCAKQVIDVADVVKYVEMGNVELVLDYKQMQYLEYQLPKLDGEILQQEFAEKIKLLIRLPLENMATLKALF